MLLRTLSWIAAVVESVMIFCSLQMKVGRLVPSKRSPQDIRYTLFDTM